MALPNYYKTLQVDPEAEPDIVKVVYRKLSLKYHPDGAAPDAERMRALNEAYEVIGDPARRKRYDAHRLHEGPGHWTGDIVTRPPSYWNPPNPSAGPSRSAPRRRYSRSLAPGTWTIFGTLIVVAFVVVTVQAVFSGAEQDAQNAPPTLAPTQVATFPTRAASLQSAFSELGFDFDDADNSDRLAQGTNEATHSEIVIRADQGWAIMAKLTVFDRSGGSPDLRAEQAAQIEALLRATGLSEATWQPMVTWATSPDLAALNRAMFTAEETTVEIVINPAADIMALTAQPTP